MFCIQKYQDYANLKTFDDFQKHLMGKNNFTFPFYNKNMNLSLSELLVYSSF